MQDEVAPPPLLRNVVSPFPVHYSYLGCAFSFSTSG